MALQTRDDEKSRIDRGYEEGFNSGNNAYIEAGLDQAEAYANDPTNHKNQDDIKNAEENGAGWDTDLSKKSGEKSGRQPLLSKDRIKSAAKFTKKKGAMGLILAIFGIGGGAMVSVLGPSSMLINITENFVNTNDSSSSVMQSRFMKIFGHLNTADVSSICTSSTNAKMKCRMGKLSNSAIRSLSKKGVVSLDANGKEIPIKRTGYPDSNPARYKMPNGDTVDAKNLTSYLSDRKNSKMARHILGTGGAFNVKAKAWTGKHITNKLFSKFRGIDRRGGFADGQNKGNSPNERQSNLKEKVKSHIKGSADSSGIANKISSRTKENLGKSRKAGAAYMIGLAGCVAVKAPTYIAAGIAAVQLAQIMPMATNYVMSPGHKAKAMEISPEDMDAMGTALTNRTENEKGKMTSALDSQYLLAAMGVNTAKPAVSKKFSPGYGVLTSSIVKTSQQANEATEGACNVIMSPAAMWSATAASSVATVALSATLIGGVIKIGVDVGVSIIVEQAVSFLIEQFAADAVQKVAENEDIPNAEGEELGDVIGLGAMGFFSAGGMARNIPALSESQVVAYDQIRQENEEFNRQMDVASLSPFDTSSRYTFLGSIVRSMQTAAMTSGSNSPVSLLSSVFKAPSITSSTASATLNQSQNMCGYAGQFGMDTGDPNTTPAINAAGLPCTGITRTQAGMSTEEAIQLIEAEGWIDDSQDVAEDATIDDLLGNYIKEDTPLYEFITTCSDASTGDYLYTSAGCIASGDPATDMSASACYTADDGNRVCSSDVDMEGSSEIEGVKNPRAMQAMSVFLIDFQLAQSINGFDEEDKSGMQATAGNSESAGVVVDGSAKELAQKLLDSPNVTYWDQARDASDKSRPSDNLRSIAAGELANTSTRGPAGGKKTAIDTRLLQFLVELSEKTSFQINALAGQKHSANSNHYSGTAVDFECGHNLPDIADSIASKYGLKRNHETCAKHYHWHYDVVGGS